MGRIFHRGQPGGNLSGTGERFLSEVSGSIKTEHLHRYCLARELCRGKEVLDVASGEGYGSAFLAQTAKSVIGIDLDSQSILHSATAYRSERLTFLQGSATELPVSAACVDVVVSFETLEHFQDHEQFYHEVKRVLRPGGLLILSTPDTSVYSGSGSVVNPFHVREVTKEELAEGLQGIFEHVRLLRQRVFRGSVILPDRKLSCGENNFVFEEREPAVIEADEQLPRAPYLFALASNKIVPDLPFSIYIQGPAKEQAQDRAEIEQVENLELALRTQAAELERMQAVEARTRLQAAEFARLQRVEDRARSQTAEIERLRAVEAAAVEQSGVLPQLVAEASKAREEAKSATTKLQLQEAELIRLRTIESKLQEQAEGVTVIAKVLASREAEAVAREKNLAGERDRLNHLGITASLARQQTLVIRRLQLNLMQKIQGDSNTPSSGSVVLDSELNLMRDELARQRGVIEELNEQLAQHKRVNNELSGLLVPVWIRKLVPAGLRPWARAMKRSVR